VRGFLLTLVFIIMSWYEFYDESEIVADHTKSLSKIWDNLMPTTYPHVLEFKTKKAVEVNKVQKMGPYSMTERFIDYDCYVLIDRQPLVKIGWDFDGSIPGEVAKKAYGENYFHDMRMKMVELSKYAGLRITSQFDFGGKLDAHVND
jgi:hypothetical protein